MHPSEQSSNPMAGDSADVTDDLTEEHRVLGLGGDRNRKPSTETHSLCMDWNQKEPQKHIGSIPRSLAELNIMLFSTTDKMEFEVSCIGDMSDVPHLYREHPFFAHYAPSRDGLVTEC